MGDLWADLERQFNAQFTRTAPPEPVTAQAHRDYLSGYSRQQTTPAQERPARGGSRDDG